MKATGVKTGEPIWEALVKCPEGIYVKRDFRWYEVLSRRMLDVARERKWSPWLVTCTDNNATAPQGASCLDLTSHSRVAKIESGASGVSLDLMYRGLFALGGTPKDVTVRRGKLPQRRRGVGG